ncbi:MAG TPA: TrbI/VirB10 family protein [Bacteriovoracaceae bacterium]|nr:TrbI/VirB10 family protein [Bacteriovoracaceae bacterium]
MNWQSYLLKEARPFTAKRDVNWARIKVIAVIMVLVVIAGVLFWPSDRPEQTVFHEKGDKGSYSNVESGQSDPSEEAARQLQQARVNTLNVHSSLDHLYRQDRPSGPGGGGIMNRNAGMILSRNGFDSRTQLSAGTRVTVHLTQKVTVSEQAMPVIGIVSKDVDSENGVAIPEGCKVLGEVSFDSANERTTILWKAIILPDGRERPFSALGMGGDGQVGLNARVQSEGLKNALGQTVTTFIGAYAAGSMNTGAFGANPGGGSNGLRNAIAETATARATAMGESLQKERKWVELEAGMQIVAVLNQPFSFRDPGGMHGE